MWVEGDLELGWDPNPQIITVNCLRRIGNNLITFKNEFPLINNTLMSDNQVEYVQDIIFLRDKEKTGTGMKEVIKVISEIGQAVSYHNSENHLDYPNWEKWLLNMKRHGGVIKSLSDTSKQSQMCVSQQYRWHMIVETEWGYLQ